MPTSAAYRWSTRLATPLVPLLLRDPRQQAAHRARLEAPARLEQWADLYRDDSRPLIWFHASSVGEGLQARAVLAALRDLHPEAQYLFTHYSPSAEQFALSVPANWSGYLGYDRLRDVRAMLDAATPNLLVFAKLDLWPELAVQAAAGGAAVAMVAGTVSPSSGRLRWPVRQLAAPGYAVLDAAVAVSDVDAARLITLGCRADRVQVAGDPRIDSVLQVVQATRNEPLLTSGLDVAKTLVAGSTWPQCEDVVLAAFRMVRERVPDASLIIAPHQPSAEHLARVETHCERMALAKPVRFTTMEHGTRADIVLVDRVGVLAQLYRGGCAAYVGGGWSGKGIHSVLEPAAWARPVVIGPYDRGSRDARLLEAAGALTRLGPPDAVDALAARWLDWLEHPAVTHAAGQAAFDALAPERGAAMRSARALEALLWEAK